MFRGDWEPLEAYRFGDVARMPRIVPRAGLLRRFWCWLTNRPEPAWGHIGDDLFVCTGADHTAGELHPPGPDGLVHSGVDLCLRTCDVSDEIRDELLDLRDRLVWLIESQAAQQSSVEVSDG